MSFFRSLPSTRTDDGTGGQPSRANAYAEAVVQPMGAGDWGFADEGSYWHASNATLATGIAGHAAPVVADTDTKALLHLYNGGTKNIIPVFLFLEVTAAGTAGTLHYTTIYVDAKGSTAKTSGGTVVTPVNTNTANTGTSSVILTFGAVVTAMSSSRKVGQQIVREVIPVVQDTVLMRFGPSSGEVHSGLTTAGTATNHCVQNFAPIVIAPGGNLNISQIRPSQSAASSYQFSFGYIER